MHSLWNMLWVQLKKWRGNSTRSKQIEHSLAEKDKPVGINESSDLIEEEEIARLIK